MGGGCWWGCGFGWEKGFGGEVGGWEMGFFTEGGEAGHGLDLLDLLVGWIFNG